MREPFFRKQTQCWYIKDSAGRFIRLDPDKQTAFDLWHKQQSAQVFDGDNATVGGWLMPFWPRLTDRIPQNGLMC